MTESWTIDNSPSNTKPVLIFFGPTRFISDKKIPNLQTSVDVPRRDSQLRTFILSCVAHRWRILQYWQGRRMHARTVLRNCTFSKEKKKPLLTRYFQIHSSTPCVLFPKLIVEYTNSHFSWVEGRKGSYVKKNIYSVFWKLTNWLLAP